MSVKYLFNKIRAQKALITICLIIIALMAAVPVIAASYQRPVPLTAYAVRLALPGPPLIFSDVRFVGSANDVVISNEKDSNGEPVTIKTPGDLKIPNVELKRALSNDMLLSGWRQKVIDGNFHSAKRNVYIEILDSKDNIVAQWELQNAWPSGLTSGIDDNSDGKLMEIVTIACEQIKRIK